MLNCEHHSHRVGVDLIFTLRWKKKKMDTTTSITRTIFLKATVRAAGRTYGNAVAPSASFCLAVWWVPRTPAITTLYCEVIITPTFNDLSARASWLTRLYACMR